MRIALIAAFLLTPLMARAQDANFEADIQEATGRLSKNIRGAKIAQDKQAQDAASSRTACAPQTDAEPKLFSSDVRWGLSMPDMLALYKKLYESDKRLKGRAHFNAATGRFELPHSSDLGGPVVVPDILIKALVRHIQAAFDKDYIDAVFFPDMGHSHLLIPDSLWKSKYDAYPVARQSRFYEDAFADPAVHVFYHTAEQLKSLKEDGTVLDDQRIKWRHKTRNIAGPISEAAELTVYQNPASKANTVGEVPGFRWWGAGFNISANKNGCFSFTRAGESVRFDISLSDLEPDPANPSYGD
ncbi:MAG: hypothetical protein COV48_13210 [Elusimicrobia bacterium CG11_big_fil_rev_8_21_14_0_20_64_6]|nr:MAG: hypothetical protein COV48_13210 [Elusimicrobia bacterium CG11_big_fil_rev_8_21_14_0_20_64_6]